jgi:CHRD domain
MKISMSRREVVVTACLAGIAAWAVPSMAAPVSFKVPLTGAQQVPTVKTAATGTADLAYDPATRVVRWNVSYSGLSGAATMAHFHGPAAEGKNGPRRAS